MAVSPVCYRSHPVLWIGFYLFVVLRIARFGCKGFFYPIGAVGCGRGRHLWVNVVVGPEPVGVRFAVYTNDVVLRNIDLFSLYGEHYVDADDYRAVPSQ